MADPRPTEIISEQDTPHRFTASGIYMLPFGKGQAIGGGSKGVLGRFIGGWEISGIWAFQTGLPLAFGSYSNTAATNNGDYFLIDNPAKAVRALGDRTADQWFNTSPFITASSAQPASHLRNNPYRFPGLRGPRQNNIDLALIKDTQITESTKIRFSAQAMNAMNHVLLPAPQLGMTSAQFGTVNSSTQYNYPRPHAVRTEVHLLIGHVHLPHSGRAASAARPSFRLTAMLRLTLSALTLLLSAGVTAEELRFVVAADRSGDFPTIQYAIDHAPPLGPNQRLVIEIRPGTYHERVVVPRDRGPVTLRGTDAATTTITAAMSAKAVGGTFFSSTVDVEADGFRAERLTFENSFGTGSQAVALKIHSDRALIRDLPFPGLAGHALRRLRAPILPALPYRGTCRLHLRRRGGGLRGLPDPQPRPRLHQRPEPYAARRLHRLRISALPPDG